MAAAQLKSDKFASLLLSLGQQFPRSRELRYAALDHAIASERFSEAAATIKSMLQADPYDWRAWFQQGRMAFLQKDYKLAAERFARIRAELPGEPAAQLALALALEAYGEGPAAETIYDRVSKADPSYASAAFGLTRCRIAAVDRAGAVKALNRVPATSALYAAAQLASVRVLISDFPGAVGALSPLRPEPGDLIDAAEALEGLNASNQTSHLLASEIFLRAAGFAEHGKTFAADRKILGRKPNPRDLRFGAEQALRQAARFAADAPSAVALVERANQARPRTLI
jgi:serine/threonine-protein kinase PknG